MGIFMKSLNEITLRRAFLDKRKCIETTLKLNYEKAQEEKLMLSILPEHIASKVSKDIWDEVRAMEEESGSKSQSISCRPFKYIEFFYIYVKQSFIHPNCFHKTEIFIL